MSKWMSALTLAGVVTVGLPACATRGYVKNRVGVVNGKVDDLSTSVEQTQERTRKRTKRLSPDVDQKTRAAQGAADQAQQSANAAGTDAKAANARAGEVATKTDELDKASEAPGLHRRAE